VGFVLTLRFYHYQLTRWTCYNLLVSILDFQLEWYLAKERPVLTETSDYSADFLLVVVALLSASTFFASGFVPH
jgi:hypothetical protein